MLFLATLYIFYPGEYVIGSFLFLVTLLVLKRDLNKMRANDENLSIANLIEEDDTPEETTDHQD